MLIKVDKNIWIILASDFQIKHSIYNLSTLVGINILMLVL